MCSSHLTTRAETGAPGLEAPLIAAASVPRLVTTRFVCTMSTRCSLDGAAGCCRGWYRAKMRSRYSQIDQCTLAPLTTFSASTMQSPCPPTPDHAVRTRQPRGHAAAS